MYLFKSREGTPPAREAASFEDGAASPVGMRRLLVKALSGEEHAGLMLTLSALLVLLLHAGVALWLLRPIEPQTIAQPLPMEVTLLAPVQEHASVAPAATVPQPAVVKQPQVRKPPPKKPLPKKPLPSKKPPPISKPRELPPVKPAANVEAVAQPVTASPARAIAPTSNSAPAAKVPPAAAEPFTEANYRANYASNPKPEYPRLARNRGWQGKVLLKVQVSAEGHSDQVAIHQSSGHDVLDEAAIAAVQKWTFIPAKRGDKPVASSVLVPIVFRLGSD